MDSNQNGVKSDKNASNLKNVESKEDVMDEESDVDDESQSLLRPEKDDLLKESEKPLRKVHWLDDTGEELAEILEFQPSDISDSDDEDSDSCICTIM